MIFRLAEREGGTTNTFVLTSWENCVLFAGFCRKIVEIIHHLFMCMNRIVSDEEAGQNLAVKGLFLAAGHDFPLYCNLVLFTLADC